MANTFSIIPGTVTWQQTGSGIKGHSTRIFWAISQKHMSFGNTPITRERISGKAWTGRGMYSLHRNRQAENIIYIRFPRSEEHTSALQSLLRNSYAVSCSTKKKH